MGAKGPCEPSFDCEEPRAVVEACCQEPGEGKIVYPCECIMAAKALDEPITWMYIQFSLTDLLGY